MAEPIGTNTGYDALTALGRRAFAWEFLRRNPAYRAAARTEQAVVPKRYAENMWITRIKRTSGVQSWGLRFRGASRRRCLAGAPLLG